MKNKMLAKCPNWFLFLAVGFLMLFSPFVGQAQNNSGGNLAETVWDTEKYPREKYNPKDNSVSIIVYFLGFYEQGKAKINIIDDKAAGTIEGAIDDGKNTAGSPSLLELRKRARSDPSVNVQKLEGTYQIKGNLVYLDFPSFTINATVTATSIEGVLTYKDTNKDEPVSFTKTVIPNNSSSDTKSSSNSSSLSGANKSPFPHAGTYSGEWSVSGIPLGRWIFSIDIKGRVNGTRYDNLTRKNSEISGFIDENGYLEASIKSPFSINSIRGTLTKEGIRLTGTLEQYSGNFVIATISIDLSKR